MFSFHKPKIYRSVNGCCICRAKSSSSRFTDSKKYEAEFERCFRVGEGREGEICNACVLLVKRWKKLPSGTNRHWHHVVDARAGPGTKSTLKLKTRPFQKHKHRSLKKRKSGLEVPMDRIPSPRELHADLSAFEDSLDRTEAFSYSQSSAHSPSISDDSDTEDVIPMVNTSRHSQRKAMKRLPKLQISSFLDLTYWKKTEICCGIIFKGLNDEVLLDPQLLNPCWACRQTKEGPNPMKRSQSTDTETLSNLSYPGQDDIDNDLDNDLDEEEEEEHSNSSNVPNPFSLAQLQCGAQQLEALQQQRVISMEC